MLLALISLILDVPAADDAIKVRSAVFVSEMANATRVDVKATDQIPFIPEKSCYSWLLKVQPQYREATITEVFELPAPASHWGTTALEKTDVATNRASAKTVFKQPLNEGVIGHGWCVAAGDPLGHYKIKVFENAKLLHQFEFDVYDKSF